jgi:hypothetical protein
MIDQNGEGSAIMGTLLGEFLPGKLRTEMDQLEGTGFDIAPDCPCLEG